MSRRVFAFTTIILTMLFVSLQSRADSVPKTKWSFVQSRLLKNGFSKPFIEELKQTYETDSFEEVVRLNVLLFLKKSDYHGTQVTSQAQQEVREFIAANKSSLVKAEKAHGVPGGVIASLLFIESRHGKNVGDIHVPSVYLHLLQAPRKDVQIYLQSQAKRYAEDVRPEQREEIRKRTHRKAKWALGELKAIEKVFKWKWEIGKSFRGSFSGAFGMPQFLPTSYIKWARSMTPPAQPNLVLPDDAIMSVGHYLRDHGWKSGSPKARMKALMKYNNSADYAKAILTLAEESSDRSTASITDSATEE